MHPLLNELIAWKEAPRLDVLRRVQQQAVHLQAHLDQTDARIAELEQEVARLKAGKKAA